MPFVFGAGIIAAMPFDFDAAVTAPFRMQPGLRRVAPGTPQLTPLPPGTAHQREKLAVLTAFWPRALCAVADFDAGSALDALCRHAATEQPQAWVWDGEQARALTLGTAVTRTGDIEQLRAGSFGLGDEVTRCLQGLPPAWRLAGLASLSFAEDFAILDASTGTIPWLAVCLPSHWAPEAKVGRHFTEVHAPVADNALLLKATAGLLRVVTGPEAWERFVWTITDHPRLNAHPAHTDPQRWTQPLEQGAWFRSEHQSFIPLPERAQAVFTIHVQLQDLAELASDSRRAAALHDAVATMSPAVLDYRGLTPVRETLLAWLDQRRR